MLLIIQFDVDADLIDVPQIVIDTRETLRAQFIKWIYNKQNKKYRRAFTDASGKKFYGVQFRGDAFVDWLNRKVLCNSKECATMVKQKIFDYPDDIPILLF